MTIYFLATCHIIAYETSFKHRGLIAEYGKLYKYQGNDDTS